MDQDEEIQELKERLANVESQLQHRSQSSRFIKFVLGFIIALVLLMVLVGIVQFISNSSA